jgi:hypothetical protein
MSYLTYLLERNMLNVKSLLLTEFDKNIGLQIANRLGVTLNGWWEEAKKFAFTDSAKTRSTFVARDYAEAKEKLEQMRLMFKREAEKKQKKTEYQLA